jgi:hypothetical protein
VLDLATGAHGRLAYEFEEPVWAWKKAHPAATHEEYERQWDAGNEEFMRRYQEELAAILQRWGMADSAALTSDGA